MWNVVKYMVFILVLPVTSIAADITLDNWMQHKKITEIRLIYTEIQSSLWEEKEKRINTESDNCQFNGYHGLYAKILLDPQGLVRRYTYGQIISHGALLERESYFDENGVNRFVLLKHGADLTRVYLDKNGKVFWSISTYRNELREAEYDENIDGELKIATSKKAMIAFDAQVFCQ